MLTNKVPDWFEVTNLNSTYLEGNARLAGTIWKDKRIALRITLGARPKVAEKMPGTELPRHCPERHLYSDSSFCMALRAATVADDIQAVQWWDSLAQYLFCQSAAAQTGIWPLHNALDHGEAGQYHAKALQLAEELGLLEEYFALHSGQIKAFSDETQSRLGHKKAFRLLLGYERARLKAVQEYRELVACDDVVCCGTMRNCIHAKRKDLTSTISSDILTFRTRLLTTTATGALGSLEAVRT